MKIITFLFSAYFLLSISAFAQDLKTKSVSIFKNGTAFFQKTGKINSKDKSFTLKKGEIPTALFGTLGFVTPNQSIVSIRSFEEKKTTKKNLQTRASILVENIGKTVTLKRQNGVYDTGKILSASNDQVMIQSEKTWVSIAFSEIVSFSFEEEPNISIEAKSSEKVISVDFNKEVSNQALDMFYLSKGLGWFPNYRLELTGEKTAILTLKAQMVNDGEDLENVDVDFVVGVPNFSYANFESPLTGTLNLEGIMNKLSYANRNGGGAAFDIGISNVQTISYGVDRNLQPDEINDDANVVTGKEQEDLFFYSLKNITLPKKGRAEFQILKAEVPIEHIYESNLQANNASRSYLINQANQKTPIPVFHKIKVNNSTKQPFTTGPTMVVKKDGSSWTPISQDKLNYTPTGGHSFLKVTTAPDVSISHKEEELTRVEGAKRIKKTVFDLVTIKGEVKVKNYKTKAIDLNVRRAITGQLGKTDEKWLTSPRIVSGSSLNAITDICWELKIKAGEEKLIKYQYQIYIAR